MGARARSSVTSISLRHDLQRAVIIAVIAMRMMQMAINQIIDVVAMRHGFMTAAGAMDVTRGMT